MLPAKITVALCWIYNLPLVQNRIFESSVVTRCFEKLFFSKNSDRKLQFPFLQFYKKNESMANFDI